MSGYATSSASSADGDAASDDAFCKALLPEVSRTFALSIEALPLALRPAVRTAYLLCRIVDTIEDEADIAPAARGRLFVHFDALMADDASSPEAFEGLVGEQDLGAGAEHRLCRNAGAVFRAYRRLPGPQRDAIRPAVLTMSDGMREYTQRADREGGLRLESIADLERYCYFVAGTVGELLTALFELTLGDRADAVRSYVRERAVSFGLGLQMVNIVKDVATDFTRGDCFLPLREAREAGLDLDDLLAPEQREAGLAVIDKVCDCAAGHLARAREYTAAWPLPEGRAVRLFCVVPLVFAQATLAEVREGDDTLRPGRTPKISREAVAVIMGRAQRAVLDDAALAELMSAYQS